MVAPCALTFRLLRLQAMQRIAPSIERFLEKHTGSITCLTSSKRYNHQNPHPSGDGVLTCITVHAEFRNCGIFGPSGPFLTEVYPRYRFLRRRLAEYLADEGQLANMPGEFSVSLVPMAAQNSRLGKALLRDIEASRGSSILPIEELANHSKYYRALADRYKIEHCLLTTKNTVVGPDAGILITACAAAQTFPDRVRVIEFGTGAATTPLALSGLEKLDSYLGNDFSPKVTNFFKTAVEPRLVRSRIECKFFPGSCFGVEISGRADLIIVGVFYQAQLDLVKCKGAAISAALADGGVLLIQSSKPENPFITSLLMDDPARHATWPWYEETFYLRKYFKKVIEANVNDETMLIATNDSDRLDRIIEILNRETIYTDIVDN
jgi:hypothetical protein